MTLNTENNSASESVNTLPKWKAILDFIRSLFGANQQKFAIVLGFVLVAFLFFNLGKLAGRESAPRVTIQEPAVDLSEVNNNLKSAGTQLGADSGAQAVAGEMVTDPNCTGKIKGNIGSSGKIYHIPGGAFYARTVPELCFDTEAEAQAAGFRKSKN